MTERSTWGKSYMFSCRGYKVYTYIEVNIVLGPFVGVWNLNLFGSPSPSRLGSASAQWIVLERMQLLGFSLRIIEVCIVAISTLVGSGTYLKPTTVGIPNRLGSAIVPSG